MRRLEKVKDRKGRREKGKGNKGGDTEGVEDR